MLGTSLTVQQCVHPSV